MNAKLVILLGIVAGLLLSLSVNLVLLERPNSSAEEFLYNKCLEVNTTPFNENSPPISRQALAEWARHCYDMVMDRNKSPEHVTPEEFLYQTCARLYIPDPSEWETGERVSERCYSEVLHR